MIICGLSANYCIGQVQPGHTGHSNKVNEENSIKGLLRKLWAELKEVSKSNMLCPVGQKQWLPLRGLKDHQ